MKMVEETAHDYTNYLQQIDFAKEVRVSRSRQMQCLLSQLNAKIATIFRSDPFARISMKF